MRITTGFQENFTEISSKLKKKYLHEFLRKLSGNFT